MDREREEGKQRWRRWEEEVGGGWWWGRVNSPLSCQKKFPWTSVMQSSGGARTHTETTGL